MSVDLILYFTTPDAMNKALSTLGSLGVSVRRTIPTFNTIAVTIPESAYSAILKIPDLVQAIRDVPVRPAVIGGDFSYENLSILTSNEAGQGFEWPDYTVTEPEAQNYMGLPPDLTGSCVRVAVLDTGVDCMHSALQGKVARIVRVSKGNPNDAVGHGTWCAGIIAGRETDSPLGTFRGIAPDARIIDVNVLDDDGNGQISDIMAGLEVAYRLKVDLVSMSLGTAVDLLIDPVADAIRQLADHGTITVCAAGNFGPVFASVGVPGSSPAAVTVAASTVPIPQYIDGRVPAQFSSRGPTIRAFFKPDVAAPGGAGTSGQKPQLIYGPCVGALDAAIDHQTDEWAPLRGSSMATPQVTGILALLMERYKFSRQQLDEALQATSYRSGPFRDLVQGWGFMNPPGLATYFETRRLLR